MKMLMENWNQFVNEEMSQEDILRSELEKEGFDSKMAARLADELMDEEAIVQAISKMNEESAKDAGAMTGAGIGSLAYVAAQFRDAMNSGLAQDEIVQMLSNDPTIPGAFLAALGVYGLVGIKNALKDAMRDPAEKEREIYRRRMEEGMEEMSDDEEVLDLLQDLSAPDIVVALVNWVKGGEHTMNDLQMQLGKMMK
jgi:hypothetical protein